MDWNEFMEKQMQDPEFREAWDWLMANLDIAAMMIQFRAQRGISQRELARMAGLSPTTVSQLENGLGNPRLNTLKKLAKAME